MSFSYHEYVLIDIKHIYTPKYILIILSWNTKPVLRSSSSDEIKNAVPVIMSTGTGICDHRYY